MPYFFRSLATQSFWKYALFTKAGLGRVFSTVGVIWTFMEILDFLGIYKQDQYGKFAIFPIIGFGLLYAVARVRPVTKIVHKVPSRDLCIEVRVGDLLSAKGGVVISTSSTFETDMASGLISPNSLQGQLVARYFQGNTTLVDQQLDTELSGKASIANSRAFGKPREYEIGTVAKVSTYGNNYYFLAMSKFTDQQNAYSELAWIDQALESLWVHLAVQGDFDVISLPLLGTGRGRLSIPRKKMIERIAQSFVDACSVRKVASRLVMYIHPTDASEQEINLFEVKDYLAQSIHA